MPYLIGALADPSYIVRQAACIGVGQFSDNLQPEIIEHHPVILPALLQGVNVQREAKSIANTTLLYRRE